MSTVMGDASIIRDVLDAIRARWRRRALYRAAARAGAGLAVTWGAAWVTVRTGALSGLPLTVTAALALVASAAWIALLRRRREPVPGDRALARHVEERHPDSRGSARHRG